MPLNAEQQRQKRADKRAVDEAHGVFRRKRGRIAAGHVWDEQTGAAVLNPSVATRATATLGHLSLRRTWSHSRAMSFARGSRSICRLASSLLIIVTNGMQSASGRGFCS